MAGCKPVLKIEGATVPQIFSYAIFQRARHSHPDIFNFFQKGPTLVISVVLRKSIILKDSSKGIESCQNYFSFNK